MSALRFTDARPGPAQGPRLHFSPLRPHPPLARAWCGPWPRHGAVPWWPRVVRPVEIFQCRGCLGYCEDCGKPVRVDDPAYGLDMESGVYVCATCAQKWSGGPRRTSPDHGAVTEPGSAADPR